MSLLDMKSRYRQGSINKADYIAEMYKLHNILFEYSRFIKDTDIASIEIKDGGVLLTSREEGIKLLCPRADRRIAPIEILNLGFYEKTSLEMMLKLIGPRFAVFDIGANIGWYTLNIARHFADSVVFSFEPIPLVFRELKANLELNGFKNVKIYDFGFSDREEKAVFYFNPEESVSASMKNIHEDRGAERVRCRLKKLDDFVEANGIKNMDFIKCDVEGGELLVFQGGLKSIERYEPIVFTEMLRKWSAKFGYHPNDMIALFSNLGYRCFTVKDGRLAEFFSMDEDETETNFFFLHSVKHSAQIESLISR